MAEMTGYGGRFKFSDASVTISDATYNIYSWSLDYKCDPLDVTGFADGGDRTYTRGLKGWTASAEAYVDGSNGIDDSAVGDSATLWLYMSDTIYYRGTAYLTGLGTGVKVDGVETQTLSFQGTGALVYSDAA